jgi:hypothetical protein
MRARSSVVSDDWSPAVPMNRFGRSLGLSRIPDTGYGSVLLSRACRIDAACGEIEAGGPQGAWRRVRAGSALVMWYRLCLPSITIRLTRSPAGCMIAEHLTIRADGGWRYRHAQGVLPLPAEFSDYLRGRQRQAVRTNVNHARNAEFTVRSSMIHDWKPGDDDSRNPHISPGPVERWTAFAPWGGIVAEAILSVDEDVALLHGLVSWASYARWLLHTAIVERLCGRCSLLLTNTDDAYRLDAGAQHFQRLLGYQIARLRVHRPISVDRASSWGATAAIPAQTAGRFATPAPADQPPRSSSPVT